MRILIILWVGAMLGQGCGWTMTVQPMAAPAATPAATSAPVSPLAEPMAMAASAPATFGLAELEAAAEAAGIELRPGTYSCDLLGDDYARCAINVDGVPGGQICVWADGWGACE